jgi:hypothetical protein
VSCGDLGNGGICVVVLCCGFDIRHIFSILCKVVNSHGIGCSVVTGKGNHILIVKQESPWLCMKRVQSAVSNDELIIY